MMFLFYYLCIYYAVQKVLIITHKYIVSDIQAMFVLYCFIVHFLIEFVNYVNVNEKIIILMSLHVLCGQIKHSAEKLCHFEFSNCKFI